MSAADRDKQVADIRAAIEHPGRQVPLPCDEVPEAVAPLRSDGSGFRSVHADRFGRLWTWDGDMLTMIFDPREARG